jgi:membrane protease YdiL (CAAX protease family)
MHLLRRLYYALLPLFILLIAIIIACVIGYVIVVLSDNNLPLNKTISRITELLLVLTIFPAMAVLKIDKTALGFAKRTLFFKQLLKGLALGVITLLPVFILLYALGVHVIDDTKLWTLGFFFKKASLALLTAFIIALLEEPLFRGIVLIGLQRKLSLIAAIILSAVYYSGLHFLQNKTQINSEELSLSNSFIVAAHAFANLANASILSAFIALLMVGLFLALIRVHFPASLGLCIGCHTGWVWQIKLSKEFFNTNSSSDYAYLVSSYDGVIGGLVSLWLLLLIAIYLRVSGQKRLDCTITLK